MLYSLFSYPVGILCVDFPINERLIQKKENRLFLKQWIRNPAQIGTFAPITQKLADQATAYIDNKNARIIELGAGTGRLTRSILRTGIDPQKFAIVELDPKMCDFLNHSLSPLEKKPTVVCGDASKLECIVPSEFVDQTDLILSVLPLVYFPKAVRQQMIEAAFRVLKPGGRILHITYKPSKKSPIHFMDHVQQKRVESLWWNLPPGFVWEFSRTQKHQASERAA